MNDKIGKPSRVKPWIAGGGLHRLGANLVTVAVGGIAGYISWLHLFALGLAQPITLGLTVEQERRAAGLTPFSIDGMIVAGTFKLRQARIEGRPAHWAAYAAVILGVALTMAGNIASAPDAFWAQMLAAAPPAAFLVSVEVLMGRPLSRNLWDLVRDLWRRLRADRALRRAGRRSTAAVTSRPPAEVPAPVGPEPDPVIAALIAEAGILARPEPRVRQANGRKPDVAPSASPLPVRRNQPHAVVYRGETVPAGEVSEHVRRVALAMVATGGKVSGKILSEQYEPSARPSVRQCVEYLKPIRAQLEQGAGKSQPVAG